MVSRVVVLFAFVAVLAVSAGCAQPAPAPAAPVVQNTAADQAKLQEDALIWFEHYANGNAEGWPICTPRTRC